MPNWVYNTVTVTATDPGLLDRIEHELAAPEDPDGPTVLSFQKLVPRPEAANDDWYNWNINHWGTKWDACQATSGRTSPTELVFSFNTAWSPPAPVIQALTERYPAVTIGFRWEEEQGYGGELTLKAGVASDERTWDIPSTHAEVLAAGHDCDCDETTPTYGDCFFEQARLRADESPGVFTDSVLAVIGAYSPVWRGSLDELIATATAVVADPATPAAALPL